MGSPEAWSMADFGLFVFPYQRAGTALDTAAYVDLAQHIETLGFSEFSLPHASRQAPSTERAEGPFDVARTDRLVIFDPLLLAPVVATATTRLRFGLHSAVLPLLHPYHWARLFATLDVMTGGRIDAGMCIGGIPKEFDALGVPWNQRGRMADECLGLIKRLWQENGITHAGAFFKLQDATVDPKPVQKPHPPIWWGGGVASIRRAVRSCDWLLIVRPTPAMLREEFAPRIRDESHPVGRQVGIAGMVWVEVVMDNRDIEREILPGYRAFGDDLRAHAVGRPEEVARTLRELRAAGMSHFVLDFNRHGVDSLKKVAAQLELFTRYVVPALTS
jgi:alkanesulfonate monooxygenase SsuD/methylene tetrahydromethanopterin reductase-like flavin-dependent oxidoreductase (luciferase family)